jgi:hypothetical protein
MRGRSSSVAATSPRTTIEEIEMTRFGAITLLGLALITFSAPAMAGDFDQPGFYVVLGGFTGFENFPEENQFDIDADVETTLGFQARFGMRMMPYLAAEIQGDFLGGFPVIVDTMDDGRVPLELKGGNITGNIRAILPLGRFEPYAKVGIGGMWSDLRTAFATGVVCRPGYWGWWCDPTYTRLLDGGGFVAKFGGGMDLWITEDFALTMDVEYVLPTGDIENLQYLNLGWAAKFQF